LYQCCINHSRNRQTSPNVVKAKFLKALKSTVFMRVSEPPVSLGVQEVGGSCHGSVHRTWKRSRSLFPLRRKRPRGTTLNCVGAIRSRRESEIMIWYLPSCFRALFGIAVTSRGETARSSRALASELNAGAKGAHKISMEFGQQPHARPHMAGSQIANKVLGDWVR
jgi:hypothetical protein